MAKDKYYLYVDDSGWRYPEREQASREDGMDYFALGGILVRGDDRTEVIEKWDKFCKKWNITYPLHSSDIRGRRNEFSWLGNNDINEQFSKDLIDLMCNIPVIGFAVVVDRVGYNNRYKEKHAGKPWWMCKTAFCILIERVSKYVQSQDRRFKIVCEISGKKEEKAIIEYFRNLRKEGSPFNAETSAKYGSAQRELYQQIPYGDPEFATKNNPLLQIADLFLYPMVKGGYDPSFYPYDILLKNGKLIDSLLASKEEKDVKGIKYYCFDPK